MSFKRRGHPHARSATRHLLFRATATRLSAAAGLGAFLLHAAATRLSAAAGLSTATGRSAASERQSSASDERGNTKSC